MGAVQFKAALSGIQEDQVPEILNIAEANDLLQTIRFETLTGSTVSITLNAAPDGAKGVMGVVTNVGCSGGGNLRFWAGGSTPPQAINLNIPGANYALNLSSGFMAGLDGNRGLNLGFASIAGNQCGYAVDVLAYIY